MSRYCPSPVFETRSAAGDLIMAHNWLPAGAGSQIDVAV